MRTLCSLSPGYQGVPAEDYEVILVENDSARLLGEERARTALPGVRYVHRHEPGRSPSAAVNFGVSQARADRVGIMVDGARLLSPGVVPLALLSARMSPESALSVPGYHLGSDIQQEAVRSGYDEDVERRLLTDIQWPSDGYRLFDIACFSGSCREGFLLPYSESNCLCLPRAVFERIGGMDEGFRSPGGGYVNLDLHARVCAEHQLRLFVTPGEGTFHQVHGGVSTGGISGDERDRFMDEIALEYERLRGRPYEVPAREAFLLGSVAPAARRFLQISARALADRAG